MDRSSCYTIGAARPRGRLADSSISTNAGSLRSTSARWSAWQQRCNRWESHRAVQSSGGKRNSSCHGWVSEQHCLETGLLKVAIGGQCARNPALFHNQKRQAIGKAPILIASSLIKAYGCGDG